MNEPKIVQMNARKLVGIGIQTSLSENRSFELWSKFKPRVKDIKHNAHIGFFSVQQYEPNVSMKDFTPTTIFEKWAATEVTDLEDIPEGLDTLHIEAGLYAIFIHRGLPSAFAQTGAYIFGTWLPHSDYDLDDRAHFELMDEHYRLNDPEAEEEVWIPIRPKK